MKSKFYKLEIEFFGSRFLGWQIQKDFSPTVQGELNKALAQIFKTKQIQSIGSGRTDTKVHSLGHIVKFEAPFELAPQAIVRGLNSILSEDIRVKDASECHEGFKPTNHALKKEYIYLFSNLETPRAFQNEMMSNNRFKLDFDKMQQACSLFIGLHDFKNFYCTGSDISSTVREIFECEITFCQSQLHGVFPPHYKFRIVGSGFLKQMVRLIMGTIWEVGKGKVSLNQLEAELKSPGNKKLGVTAPPQGLFKTQVWYE